MEDIKQRQPTCNENDKPENSCFHSYLDSIIAEQRICQERDELLRFIESQTAELRELRDELSELKQQNKAIAERMNYLEEICLTDVSDELMKSHQMEVPGPEPPECGLPSAHKESIAQRVTRRIISGILLFVCIALLLSGIAAFMPVGGNPLLGFRHFHINSPSMLPELPIGSVVLTRVTERINVGDNITVRIGDGVYLTHKVVEIVTDHGGELVYRTKGVNNQTADSEPFGEALVAGKVVLCIPLLGGIMDYIKSHLPFVIALFVLMLLTSLILRRKPRITSQRCESLDIHTKNLVKGAIDYETAF